jgi:hypothetical protein
VYDTCTPRLGEIFVLKKNLIFWYADTCKPCSGNDNNSGSYFCVVGLEGPEQSYILPKDQYVKVLHEGQIKFINRILITSGCVVRVV